MINERFKLIKKLGEGRSKVYLCSDLENDNKKFAIKILPADVDKYEVGVFKEEYLTLRKLNHPNIISVFDYGTILKVKEGKYDAEIIKGSKYILTEYFEGRDLLSFYKDTDNKTLVEIIVKICYVLYYLHNSNYYYADLKPDNILVKINNGEPELKFVDFGLSYFTKSENKFTKRGTAEYIAPEILAEQPVDHKIDFYALGIILYRIKYGIFPFDNKNELEIYKAHLDKEFQFPEINSDNKTENVIKKLLSKEPDERYSNALQIIEALDVKIDENFLKQWRPAGVFVINNAVVPLKNYINSKSIESVEIIRGRAGSGKTSTVEEIYHNFEGIVLINRKNYSGGKLYWKSILKQILYTDFIYESLGSILITRIENLLISKPDNLVEELKSVISNITQRVKFAIIFDDFNNYDPFTLQLMSEIIPILIVNNIKIIITEDTESKSRTDFINNPKERNLLTFTEEQINSFLSKTFSDDFPKEKIKNYLVENSDLLPGPMIDFIENLFFFNLINITSKGISFESDQEKLNLLKGSHNEVYSLRLENLNEVETELTNLVALFDGNITIPVAAGLMHTKFEDISEIIENLQRKNILQDTLGSEIRISSAGLRNYVYDNIKDKEGKHFELAEQLLEQFPRFDKSELARQYELAEKYDKAYDLYLEIIADAGKIAAYSYQRELLESLLKLPFDLDKINNLKLLYCQTLLNLRDSKNALSVIEELFKVDFDKATKQDLKLKKANCLIGLGEWEEGIEIYQSVIHELNVNQREKVNLEIAIGETYINRFKEAKEKCESIVNSDYSENILKGRAYNLLGFMEYYQFNNPDTSVEYFNKALDYYKEEKINQNIVQTESNLGIVYYNLGKLDKADEHWHKALHNNSSIGSLDNEANIVMNYGVLYYSQMDFEKAIKNYERAHSIFIGLGNKSGEGMVQAN